MKYRDLFFLLIVLCLVMRLLGATSDGDLQGFPFIHSAHNALCNPLPSTPSFWYAPSELPTKVSALFLDPFTVDSDMPDRMELLGYIHMHVR